MGVTEDYLPLGGARSVPPKASPDLSGPRAYTARRRGGSTPSLFFFIVKPIIPRRNDAARRHSIPLLTHASLCCRLNPCRIQAGTTPGVSAASRAPAASAVALGALLFCSASLNVAQVRPRRRGARTLRLRARPGVRAARAAAAGQRQRAPPGRRTRASRRVPARRGSGWRPLPAAATAPPRARPSSSEGAPRGAPTAADSRSWRRGWSPGATRSLRVAGARGTAARTLAALVPLLQGGHQRRAHGLAELQGGVRPRFSAAETEASTGPRTCGTSPAAARRPGATRA